MNSFDAQARKLCIGLVRYSNALRDYLNGKKRYRVSIALIGIIPALFDTSVSENQWLDSESEIRDFRPKVFAELLTEDSNFENRTKRAIDIFLNTLHMTIWDSDAVLGKFIGSREIPLHFSFSNLTPKEDKPCKYLVALESLKEFWDTGETSLVENAIMRVVHQAVYPGRKVKRELDGTIRPRDFEEISETIESDKTNFARKVDQLDEAILMVRDSLRRRPFLDLEVESGQIHRIEFQAEIDLGAKPKQRLLFELCYKAKGNPTDPAVMKSMVYGEKKVGDSTLSTLKSELNREIEPLKIEVDSNYRLVDIRPEYFSD